MSAFRYEAIDPTGRTLKGVIDADSARAGRSQLRTQGLTPLVVELAAQRLNGARQRRLSLGRKLSQREQAILTRQLASLLDRGAAARRGAGVLTEQAEREYMRELMAAIRAEVVGGHSFANALTQHPRDFPDIYRALVAAGEHTGKLGIVLARLADYIEQSNALKQKILLAFTYPGIVTLIAFGIVTFLLSYVVPQVVNVFASTKQQLPLLTIVMMALSEFRAALVVGDPDRGRARLCDPQGRCRAPGRASAFDRWVLTAPLAGKLVRGYNTVRFASTLGI
jgi:general secretion pathway protein F